MLNGVIDPPMGILKSDTWLSINAKAIHTPATVNFLLCVIAADIKKPPYGLSARRLLAFIRFPSPTLLGAGTKGYSQPAYTQAPLADYIKFD